MAIHTFNINNQTFKLDSAATMAVYALNKNFHIAHPVLAIQLIRTLLGGPSMCGLLEAKLLNDFIRDHAYLDNYGTKEECLRINAPTRVVTYRGETN